MNEQFAFAIAFDRQSLSSDGTESSSEWQGMIQHIEGALIFEGIAGFESPRWEEFGEGLIYWGTLPECESIDAILTGFPVSIYRERNLDAGFYACSYGVYLVDEIGNILGLDLRSMALNDFYIKPLVSIPLEAYRTSDVEPNIVERFNVALVQDGLVEENNAAPVSTVDTTREQNFQEEPKVSAEQLQYAIAGVQELVISSENTQVLQKQECAQIQTQEFDADHLKASEKEDDQEDIRPGIGLDWPLESSLSLKKVNEEQSELISELEGRLSLYKSQVHDLEHMLDRKVDPEMHSQLQQHSSAQSEEIADLEQELNQLKQIHAQYLASESQRISAEEYERLGQVSTKQSQTIATLETQIQQLKSELAEAKIHAATSVGIEQFNALKVDCDQQSQVIKQLEKQAMTSQQQLQDMSNQLSERIERKEFEAIQMKSKQLISKIDVLEQGKESLQEDVIHWQQIANTKVTAEAYEEVHQQTILQTQQLQELTDQAKMLHQESSDWQKIANERVERREYEAVLSELDRLNNQFPLRLINFIKRLF